MRRIGWRPLDEWLRERELRLKRPVGTEFPSPFATGPYKSVGLGGGGTTFVPSISPFQPTLVFVACDLTGLYFSQPGGGAGPLRWQLIDEREMLGHEQCGVAFDPGADGSLYAYHQARGLRSLAFVDGMGNATTPDQGKWTTLAPGAPWDIPGSIVTATALEATNSSVLVGMGARRPRTSSGAPADPQAGVYVFDISGGNWSAQPVLSGDVVGFFSIPGPFVILAYMPTVVFCATRQGVFVGQDDFTDFSRQILSVSELGRDVPRPARIQSLAGAFSSTPALHEMDSKVRLYVTVGSDTDGRVFAASFSVTVRLDRTVSLTSDGGISFDTDPAGFRQAIWKDITQSLNLTAPAPGDPSTPPVERRIACARNNLSTVFVGVGVPDANGFVDGGTPDVQRFDGDGTNWESVFAGSLDQGWIDAEPVIHNGFGGIPVDLGAAPNESDTVLFTNKAGVYLTRDGGVAGCLPALFGISGPNWTQVYTQKVSAGTSPYVGLWRSIGMEVTTAWRYQVLTIGGQSVHFICYTDDGLARSTDGDVWSWSALQKGQPPPGDFLNFYELAVHGGAVFGATGPHDLPKRLLDGNPVQSTPGIVVVSNDGGATWSPGPVFSGQAVVSIIEVPSGTGGAPQLWISSMGSGVFFLNDANNTWTKMSPPVTASANFYRLQVFGNQLFCVIVGDPSGKRGELWRGTIVPGTGVAWDASPLTATLAAGKPIFPVDFAIDSAGNIVLCLANASGGFNVVTPDAYFLPAGSNAWSPESIPFNARYGDPLSARPFAPFFAGDGALFVTTLGHGTYQKTATGWTEAFADFPFLYSLRMTFVGSSTFLTTFGAGAWRVA